jgi:hypothetical protein
MTGHQRDDTNKAGPQKPAKISSKLASLEVPKIGLSKKADISLSFPEGSVSVPKVEPGRVASKVANSASIAAKVAPKMETLKRPSTSVLQGVLKILKKITMG